jgi:hypothetical protein
MMDAEIIADLESAADDCEAFLTVRQRISQFYVGTKLILARPREAKAFFLMFLGNSNKATKRVLQVLIAENHRKRNSRFSRVSVRAIRWSNTPVWHNLNTMPFALLVLSLFAVWEALARGAGCPRRELR